MTPLQKRFSENLEREILEEWELWMQKEGYAHGYVQMKIEDFRKAIESELSLSHKEWMESLKEKIEGLKVSDYFSSHWKLGYAQAINEVLTFLTPQDK